MFALSFQFSFFLICLLNRLCQYHWSFFHRDLTFVNNWWHDLWKKRVHPNVLEKSYCISPNVGRYFGLVTGPPPPPAMEAMEAAAMEAAAAATERFRRERSSVANLTWINLIFWIYLTYTLIQTPIEHWVHISKIDRLLTDWPSIMSMGFGGDTSTRHLCRAAV